MAKRKRKGSFAAPNIQLPALGDDPEQGVESGGDDTARRVWKHWKASTTHLEKWHTEAKTCYDFVAGRQWDQEDIDTLTTQQRPVITFNRTGTTVDAVAGYEINGRQDVTFLPRTIEDSGPAEVESDANRYFRGECEAEDEESDAFYDVLVSGLGCVGHSMDYEVNPEGMMEVERIDIFEMRYDPTAKKRNLSDRRWDQRGKWHDRKKAAQMWPDADWDAIPLQNGSDGHLEGQSPINVPENAFYRTGSKEGYDETEGKVFIIEETWFELEPFYSVANPETGALEKLEPDAHKKIQEAAKAAGMPPLKSVKRTKRKYKRAYVCGPTTLEEGDAPCPDMFHHQFMTGKRDRNKNHWFGIVRAMLDPQRWSNKFLSQYLHMINSNVKGGIDYEEGAFADISVVEQNQSKPGATLKIEPGFFEKVRRTNPTEVPNNVFQLVEFAVTSLRDVTGVNVELLGTADRNQPGVLENQRKQSAMAILAPIFDSQRRYRKKAGHLEMYFIREFLSDGRLIRITGEENAKFVPLTKRDGFDEYDIVVDEAPTAPNQKEAAFAVIMQVLPATMKMGVPTPPEVLDYIPGLPQKLVEAWKKLLTAPPDPKKTIMEILEGLEKMAIIEKDGTQAEKNKADALAKTGGVQISAIDTIGQLMLALKQSQQPPDAQPMPGAPPGGMPAPQPALPGPEPTPASPFGQHFNPPETVQ